MKPETRFDVEKLKTAVNSRRAEFESKLAALVEIPTVSMDPHRDRDMQRGAELAAQYIRAYGGRADVVPTGGHPMVLGEIKTGNHRWVTVYNHLDVQPATPVGWSTRRSPSTRRTGYFGRGATDDKGPALVALFAARRPPPSACRSTSASSGRWRRRSAARTSSRSSVTTRTSLHTDSVLVSDTIWVARGTSVRSTTACAGCSVSCSG